LGSAVEPTYASACTTPYTPDVLHTSQSFEDSGYDSSYISQDFAQDLKYSDKGSFTQLSGLDQLEYERQDQAQIYGLPEQESLPLSYLDEERTYAGQSFSQDNASLPITFGNGASVSLNDPLFESAESVPLSATSSSFDTPILTPSTSSIGTSSAGLYDSFDFEPPRLDLPVAIVPSQAYTEQSFFQSSSPLSAASETKQFLDADDGAFLDRWNQPATFIKTRSPSILPQRLVPTDQVLRSTGRTNRRNTRRTHSSSTRPRRNRGDSKPVKCEDRQDANGNIIEVADVRPGRRIKLDANGDTIMSANGNPEWEYDTEPIKRTKCTYAGCKSTFTRTEHLTRHVSSHTNERRHECALAPHTSRCILKKNKNDENAASRGDNLGDHLYSHIRAGIILDIKGPKGPRNGPITLLSAQKVMEIAYGDARARTLMRSIENHCRKKLMKEFPGQITEEMITFPHLRQ